MLSENYGCQSILCISLKKADAMAATADGLSGQIILTKFEFFQSVVAVNSANVAARIMGIMN
jgi:hypothetical protein